SSGGGSGSGSGAGSRSGGGAGAGSDAPPAPGDFSGGGSSGGTPPSSGSSGGSSGGGDAPSVPGGSSGGGSSGSPPASGGSSGGNDGSTPPPAEDPVAFAASVVQAPADGATIRGPIRLRVEGSGIRNVELLPAEGYAPLIARGVVTGDGIGAYIDRDSTVLEDGELTVRIAAFNARPGEGGSEITAMPPRTWIVENSPLEEAPTDVGVGVSATSGETEDRVAACVQAGLP